MKKGIALLDYVFLLRPTLFYPVWTFFLAGFWYGSRSVAVPPPLWVLILSSSSLTFLMGGVYILNQIEDRKTDLANGKLFLLANGIVSVKAAVLEAFLLMAVALFSGFFLNPRFAFLLIFLALLAGLFYNYAPFDWKDKPFMGLITNTLGGVFIYSAGRFSAGDSGTFSMEALAYASAVAAAYLSTTLPDVKGDAKTGKVTFAVRYGTGKTVVWSLVFETLSVVLALVFRNWILFFPALLAFPFFIRAAVKKTIPDSVRATKMSILALAASVCVVYPLYLLPIVCVFFLSKGYYKKRFGFDYPSLKST